MSEQDDIQGQLTQSVGFSITLTYRLMRRQLYALLAREGLEYSSWIILRILWIRNGCTQKQLCAYTDLSQPSLAAALKSMKERGLVFTSEDPKDRRVRYVHLSERAAVMKNELLARHEDHRAMMLEGLDDSEVENLKHALSVIRRNILSNSSRK